VLSRAGQDPIRRLRQIRAGPHQDELRHGDAIPARLVADQHVDVPGLLRPEHLRQRGIDRAGQALRIRGRHDVRVQPADLRQRRALCRAIEDVEVIAAHQREAPGARQLVPELLQGHRGVQPSLLAEEVDHLAERPDLPPRKAVRDSVQDTSDDALERRLRRPLGLHELGQRVRRIEDGEQPARLERLELPARGLQPCGEARPVVGCGQDHRGVADLEPGAEVLGHRHRQLLDVAVDLDAVSRRPGHAHEIGPAERHQRSLDARTSSQTCAGQDGSVPSARASGGEPVAVLRTPGRAVSTGAQARAGRQKRCP
jgi:hypothetical protein